MLKRILALLLTAAVLAGGGALLVFHIATSQLDAGWQDWAERRRADGWTIQHRPVERGPYALEATIRLPGLNLAAPNAALPGGFAFSAEELTLALSPADLKGVTLRPDGEQAVTLGGVRLPLRAQSLSARIALDGSATRLDGTALRLGQDQPLTIAALAFSQTGENLQLTADRLSHASLPLILRGFGNTIQTLRADLRAQPAAIELRQVQLRWGALAAELSGTLTPDERRQPAGRLTLRLRGADELLTSLAQTGLVPQSGITAARLIVRMSARDPGDGQGPMVELPAEIRGGALTIARIPIARLPPLEWR